jgi:hypothetical protein
MTQSTIAEFVSHLKSLDIQLLVEGKQNTSSDETRLRCNAPAGTLTPELRQELSNRKTELVLYLHQEKTANAQSLSSNPQPLSFAQQRLWFLYQLTPNSPFYNVPAAIRLIGKLDQVALERSFQEIVRRHAALRTTFTTVNGQPVQVVEPDVKVKLSVVDLHTVAHDERERISQQLATTEAHRSFKI